MSLKRTTVVIEERDWKRFRSLLNEYGKRDGSYHLREAMRLYLKVLETEAKIFEIQDQEPEESLHAITGSTPVEPYQGP